MADPQRNFTFTLNRSVLLLLVVCVILPLVLLGLAQSGEKKTVANASDLPRFTYPVKEPASQLVQADDATFNAFAKKVQADLDSVFQDYDIQDKATLRDLLYAKISLQELNGDYTQALKTVGSLRAMQEKPAAKLTSGLTDEAWLRAIIATHSTTSPEFKTAFAKNFREAIDNLPWETVQEDIREELGDSLMSSKAGILAEIETDMDPATRTSGALDSQQAWELIEFRSELQFLKSVGTEWRSVLRNDVAAHNAKVHDIWPSRDVTFSSSQKLTPVLAGIWDSGVDLAIYGKRVFTDPHPTASGSHGWAFGDQGAPSTSWLYPLTPTQKKEYPGALDDLKGFFDLENAVDSPQARALQQKFDNDSPEQLHAFFEQMKVFGFYVHGTHVAGIVARGNPAVRLVVARFNDQLPDFHFPPTVEWVNKIASDFGRMSEYFRTRNVRVVNMSWSDDPQEFETWLSKTGGGANPQKRKQLAEQLFVIWRGAIENAIKGAPNTLFVCAAGNADSNASFTQDAPAGLKLPNLITVGAVNQAGEETSFTSYGPTVAVDADGFEVKSYVPGGSELRLSGTSMASPNVANLAAKLFALDPSLTPKEAIQLIEKGATTSADGRRHLIDPQRSVNLLKHPQPN
jgi:Subtilase family